MAEIITAFGTLPIFTQLICCVAGVFSIFFILLFLEGCRNALLIYLTHDKK